jgi:ankyrin repeat protein
MRRRLVITLLIPLLVSLAACEKNPAREELARMNLKFGKREFFKRVEQSDRAVVDLFLKAGMNPDARDEDGKTALMNAAHKGYADIVRLLVEHGANVSAKTKGGATALLHAAAGMLDPEGGEHAEAIRFLAEHGADVNVQPERDKTTALMYAARKGDAEMVRFLVEHGADVNAKGGQNRTALTWAAQKAPAEVVRYLLEHGADPNVELEEVEGTPLTIAEHMNRPEVVKMLKDAGAKK